MRSCTRVGLWVFVIIGLIVSVPAVAQVPDAKVDPKAQAAVQQFQKGPSVFIVNQGQWADESIRFALDGSGANVGLTDQGPRFQPLPNFRLSSFILATCVMINVRDEDGRDK